MFYMEKMKTGLQLFREKKFRLKQNLIALQKIRIR